MQPSPLATPSSKSVVTYFPSGTIGAVFFPLMFLGAFCLTAYGAATSMRTVHVKCDRSAATCSIVSSWGALSSTQSVPIDSIRSTRLDTFHGKRGALSYRVVLVTSGGDIQLSSVSSGKGERLQEKAQLDHFLSDKTEASVDVDYDEPGGVALFLIPFGLIWLWAGWFITRFVRVEVDWPTRMLSIVLVRWPLRPTRRSFELGAVRDAIVTEGRGRKGGTVYSVALVVDGQEAPVPLINMRSSGRGAKDRAAQQIRALLLRRDQGGA